MNSGDKSSISLLDIVAKLLDLSVLSFFPKTKENDGSTCYIICFKKKGWQNICSVCCLLFSIAGKIFQVVKKKNDGI